MVRFTAAAFLFTLLFFSAYFAAAQSGNTRVTPVFVSQVKLGNFADRVEALGTAKANETVVITAETSDKITEIHFEDGQTVKKGDLLVTLDKNEEEADLRAAEARLYEAQSAYDRAKGLQDSSALSRGTLQEREAALRSAEAEVESIQAQIDQRTVTAPFDGILGLREVSVGALLQPGTRITTIDDLERIKVDFDVPSLFLSTLRPGLSIAGKVEAYGDQEFTGTVSTVNTQIDPVTRTVRVRAILPNPDYTLRPGLLMTITLLKNERKALLIPEEALIKRGEKNFVYVAETKNGDTIAKQTEISLGGRQPGVIEVLSGLKEGDKIISHGTVKIGDGMKISIRAEENNDETLEELLKQKPASGNTK